LKASKEGAVEWIQREAIPHLPVVEDLPVLLERIRHMKRGDPPFAARSFYENDQLIVKFA